MLTAALPLLLTASLAGAFVVRPPTTIRPCLSTLSAINVDLDVLSEIGFGAECEKPLGVIFGENEEPYYGLVVDDVEPGLNGGKAGLRVGDQLLSINGESVVGIDFDTTMSMLQTSPSTLELVLYRGSVRTLYTILSNRAGDDDEDEEVEGAVVMDESYESPVQIDVDDYDDSPLSVGDFVNAFKNVASKVTEEMKESKEKQAARASKKEKSDGIFGGMFQQETIQLDGDDATGTG